MQAGNGGEETWEAQGGGRFCGGVVFIAPYSVRGARTSRTMNMLPRWHVGGKVDGSGNNYSMNDYVGGK